MAGTLTAVNVVSSKMHRLDWSNGSVDSIWSAIWVMSWIQFNVLFVCFTRMYQIGKQCLCQGRSCFSFSYCNANSDKFSTAFHGMSVILQHHRISWNFQIQSGLEFCHPRNIMVHDGDETHVTSWYLSCLSVCWVSWCSVETDCTLQRQVWSYATECAVSCRSVSSLFFFLGTERRSQKATLVVPLVVVVVVVVVVVSSLKIPKALLIRSGAQWNFAYTFVLIFPTDLPSQIFSWHNTIISMTKVCFMLLI